MRNLIGRNFRKKLIIAILCVILINFCFAPKVQGVAETFGGEMMVLIRDFSRGLADVIGSLVQFGLTGRFMPATDIKGSGHPSITDGYWIKESLFRYPILQVSPEVILAGKVQMLDINFIKPIDLQGDKYILKLKDTNPLVTLRNIIASWYVTLRTIAVVRTTFSTNISWY